METPAHGNLVCLLTKLYFGAKVAKVIKLLYSYDQASLKFLKSVEPNLTVEDLRKSLLILVKYQLVDYVRTIKNLGHNYEYSAVPERIFYFFRIPRFIKFIEKEEGQMAADALALLSERGIMSKIKYRESLLKFAQRSCKDATSAPTFHEVDATITSLTHRKYLVEMIDNICINIERYNRQYRDSLIVDAISNFYNKEHRIKSISRAMIDLSFENTSDEAVISAPVPIADLKNLLCPKIIKDESSLEKYLIRLSTEINYRFFLSSGNHPQKGSMFAVNIGAIIDHLMKEHLCSVVTTRFGPRCCRVFRVLLQRGPLLLKQVEEFIMLPTKDVREYSYMLIKEGLVRNRQVPKTLDNAPGKSVFIMSVEMDQVVFKIADLCCHTMGNLLLRHEFELNRNEPLLKKAEAVKQLISSEGSNQSVDDVMNTDEWNDYFNSHELSQLNWANRNLDRLIMAKSQVDETLFLAHLWLKLRPNTVYRLDVG